MIKIDAAAMTAPRPERSGACSGGSTLGGAGYAGYAGYWYGAA